MFAIVRDKHYLSQTNTHFIRVEVKNYLENLIQEVQADGKYFFTLEDVKEKFPSDYKNALKHSLNRMFNKGKLVSAYKGFYVIIPPEYSRQKMIPPELFIDALFKYLNRDYYVGLLSAAMYHGASHQQPQEYFVIINKPPMRATAVEGIKINYLVKSNLKKSGVVEKKTRAGYIKVSTPEQTALDIVEFNVRVGGLNRGATLLYELVESMSPRELEKILPGCRSIAALQRLGYILDKIINRNDLSDVIKRYLKDKKIFRVPLKPGKVKKGYNVNPQWKVIVNSKIEIDF